jgi:hypothetical protein
LLPLHAFDPVGEWTVLLVEKAANNPNMEITNDSNRRCRTRPAHRSPLRAVERALMIGAAVLAGHGAILAAQDTTTKTPPASSAKPSKSTKAGTSKSGKSAKSSSTAAKTAAKRAPAPPKWPVDAPDPLPRSILPAKRILAFYGNPLSKGMGILGALPPEQMFAKLDREVAAWNAADSAHPVQPALQLITVVASNYPGTSGKYRTRMDSALIEKVYGWAKQRNALLFLDIQVGQGTLQQELPRLGKFLARPDVHLAIDPEFSMKHHEVPGTRIGTFDAADVNYASSFLRGLVDSLKLPPKVLVVHRFRRDMLTGYKRIELDPRVQIVIDMDGWGSPKLKRESYRAYVYEYPVEYTGFKLFYHNDTRGGSHLMTPAEVLGLVPRPLYIQYQ